ncbi:hypothetical protein F4821DRAFT_257791 [Hypoxylon rubiginosum]|uniref:Uncharacterized protein n=1 Tax=Hypoxylon rubiginosum TaxID=110542 RepID=A0ACC0D7D7_9PEZI|nr:hypothetical protein F4821DRAFT_257791 [Hypoxylon rubiginosum]
MNSEAPWDQAVHRGKNREAFLALAGPEKPRETQKESHFLRYLRHLLLDTPPKPAPEYGHCKFETTWLSATRARLEPRDDSSTPFYGTIRVHDVEWAEFKEAYQIGRSEKTGTC